MKVHFPLTGFSLSGGMRAIIAVANGLADRGREVRITVPGRQCTPPFPVSPKVDIQVLGGPETSKAKYAALLNREAAAWGDILVATNFKTPYLLSKSRNKNRSAARILYFIQAYEPYTQGTLFEGPVWRKWLNRRLALNSYGFADLRCYVARVIAENVGWDSDPLLVRPGVDGEVFHPSADPRPAGPLRVGLIYRQGKLKGSHLFLEALKELEDLKRKFQVVILRVGDLPAGFPPDAEVRVSASDRDMGDFYRSLDVFVMPSLYEGCPYPPLEAMSAGAALVTSAAGGVVEYAEDGVNSLVVPTDDSRALAQAMRRAIESDSLRTALIEKGFETAKRFTWGNTVDQFEEALRRLTGIR